MVAAVVQCKACTTASLRGGPAHQMTCLHAAAVCAQAQLPQPLLHELRPAPACPAQEVKAKQLCLVAFLPHILDSKAAGREAYLQVAAGWGRAVVRFGGWRGFGCCHPRLGRLGGRGGGGLAAGG